MYLFGSGVAYVTPQGANPTPVNIGLLQEITYDESSSLKSLFGQYRRAIAVGAGTIKTTVKAKFARISGLMLSAAYYGTALVAGQVATAVAEAATIPTTPYQVTVANSATWTQDQSVVFTTTGLPLKRVASGPITGQYSVSAGVYTFAAADTGKGVLISYNYSIAGSGQQLTIGNPLLGQTVSFALNLTGYDPTVASGGNGVTLQLNNCVASKLSLGTKLEDFTIPDFEAEAYVNPANVMGLWSFPDIF
jgi:hypothetical protein